MGKNKEDKKGEKKQKKHKRGFFGSLFTFLFILLLLAVIYLLLTSKGFGFGKGDGEKNDDEKGPSTEVTTETEKNEITILVDEQKIFLDGEECKDANDLKDKISKLQSSGNTKPYVLDDSNAIKSTADEVRDVLQSLKDGIDIDIILQ